MVAAAQEIQVNVTSNADWLVPFGAAAAGAVTGGLASYLVQLRLRSRALRSEARAGALAVLDDLEHCGETIDNVIADRAWWPFYELPTEAWPGARTALAMQLQRQQIDSVAGKVRAIGYLHRGMDKLAALSTKPSTTPTKIDSKTLQELEKIRSDIREARSILDAFVAGR